MRSRFAILTMLIAGFALSTTGVGLAVSGTSGNGSAGVAQYPDETTRPDGDVSGGEVERPTQQETQPETVQAPQQVATTDNSNELPFTGLAVIPLLVAGAGLLIAGLVLRRRTGSDQ